MIKQGASSVGFSVGVATAVGSTTTVSSRTGVAGWQAARNSAVRVIIANMG
jgi:hypothetical protein